MNGRNSFGIAPISGVRSGGGHVLRRQRALDLGEVRRPVAEREHEAEAEHDPDPVAPIGLVDVADGGALPGVQAWPRRSWSRDLVLRPFQPPTSDEADDRDRDQRREDHEELQHLVVDRRREAAERDVDGDDERRDDDAER